MGRLLAHWSIVGAVEGVEVEAKDFVACVSRADGAVLVLQAPAATATAPRSETVTIRRKAMS
jgi:hypothetical protein